MSPDYAKLKHDLHTLRQEAEELQRLRTLLDEHRGDVTYTVRSPAKGPEPTARTTACRRPETDEEVIERLASSAEHQGRRLIDVIERHRQPGDSMAATLERLLQWAERGSIWHGAPAEERLRRLRIAFRELYHLKGARYLQEHLQAEVKVLCRVQETLPSSAPQERTPSLKWVPLAAALAKAGESPLVNSPCTAVPHGFSHLRFIKISPDCGRAITSMGTPHAGVVLVPVADVVIQVPT